ncbi:GNAT family N-acetyltransferase [Alkalicoccobacillus porphyridii]|uniref:GNAT family N-acetyltransferase n=1 Tax=Alkalicoccobacillus porphyridii TaxID=2597270 RepID=A0A553ZWD9_9BACI|nr:GNAT family N-acetyltransferase [Alkalicoccobacillus porphyridii]TSB45743.1 GNAT family N-acetyltransferase [Alkalicoccobacillus porphyridii]
MQIRNLKESDQADILSVVNDWWGGRDMAHMLPKLFFTHFNQTSFVVEEEGKLVGFLIGFLSQTQPNEAYIHFAGVHPDYRKKKIGQRLYQHFFKVVQSEKRTIIRCITSPQNKSSIAYHQKMGFVIEPGDKLVDGVEVTEDYDGLGMDRVRFMKDLTIT